MNATVCAFLLASTVAQSPVVRVGSKAFTESVILGEVVHLLLRDAGVESVHRRELGGTQVLFKALQSGEIDIYVEYTGTIREEIFSDLQLADESAIREQLAKQNIVMSKSLGFENTYALGISERKAQKLAISSISDLKKHPELQLGLSNEFLDRGDGWLKLQKHYGLPQQAHGLHHDLAYRGIESGTLDITDLYSTDAEIEYYNLVVLTDDKNFFPSYEAVLLYRQATAEQFPKAWTSILRLENSIDANRMSKLNKQAKIDSVPESVVAADFLQDQFGIRAKPNTSGIWQRFARNTRDHLYLVGISLGIAIVTAIPLGIFAAKYPGLAHFVLGATGVLQTIPSLALFVFMIPFLGIGAPPAIFALYLYSLLPIVRNTYTGIHDIPRQFHESAEALGLSPLAQLWKIELPMASRAILAGIKTSAVINVGTATLGALIGAGGYGQPILTGIRLDNMQLILEGAIPAAVLALLVQAAFELSERLFVPKGLRIKPDVSRNAS